jgi:hypothetical protein
MSDGNGSGTESTYVDLTPVLTVIAEQLTIIANYFTSLGQGGGLSPAVTRAMTVNALKSSGQLNNVINEMNNPTPL